MGGAAAVRGAGVGRGHRAADPQEGQRERGEPQPPHVAAEAGVEAPACQRLTAEVVPAAFGNPRRGHAEREQDDQRDDDKGGRSEEPTSELQSLMRSSYAVFCLKKTTDRTR